MIQLGHVFAGQTVLVFGGGAVGARKARRFGREARVVVVSPAFERDAFDDADGPRATPSGASTSGIELVRAEPTPDAVPDWIERTDPVLVVAATDDETVNDAVASAARESGALLNRADRAGDRGRNGVVVPATVRDGPVTVSVSTGGKSPALSKYLRERIETEFAGAGAMAELTGELRAELKAEGVPPSERRDAIRAVVRSSQIWKSLRSGDTNARTVAEHVIRDDRGGDR
jgi:precorrin-2 dehydrogenase/sirohydrochlorin ferrochelatase